MGLLKTVWIFACFAIISLASSTIYAQTIIVDNSDSGFSMESGSWTLATSATDKYGADYRYTGTASSASVKYTPTIPTAGYYKSVSGTLLGLTALQTPRLLFLVRAVL